MDLRLERSTQEVGARRRPNLQRLEVASLGTKQAISPESIACHAKCESWPCKPKRCIAPHGQPSLAETVLMVRAIPFCTHTD